MSKRISLFLAVLLFTSVMALAQVATPVFAPNAADGAVPFDVTVTCATSGASIYYTTDGIDPTQASTPLPGDGKVHIARHLTLKARAYLSGTPSAVASSYYRVTGAIYAGANHAIGLKSNQTAWSWGYEEGGRLGNGSGAAVDIVTPQAVSKTGPNAFNDVVTAGVGMASSYVADSAGRLWAFGNNAQGQVGDNTTTDVLLGKRVLKASVAYGSATELDFLGNSTDGKVTAISGGYKHAIAIENGMVWGWGERASGRIGDNYVGGSSFRKYATKVVQVGTLTQLSGAVQVAAGKAFSLALCNVDSQGRGQVWSCGGNGSGQLCLNSMSPTDQERRGWQNKARALI